MLAPICLFTYNRPIETKQTIEALKKNRLASESELFIFSDGAKNENSSVKIHEVREYLSSVEGFKSVETFFSATNKGLANSIIDGVSLIIKKYGKVIVLEDDLVTSSNFLDFMNQALDFYTDKKEIFSISGYSMDLPSLQVYNKDFYMGVRASSWGWGTWLNRWQDVDWQVKDYNTFKWNFIKQLKFAKGGSDMPYMLRKQMNGSIDSWAIRWCYHQFKCNQFTVFPSKSKIISIGFGENATHTKKTKRFTTNKDEELKYDFSFDNNIIIDPKLISEFRAKFSFLQRLKDKFII